jgi:translation initiation factor 2D
MGAATIKGRISSEQQQLFNINSIGGGDLSFDNGHYGNAGFVKGQFVYPFVVDGGGGSASEDDEEEDDDDDDVEDHQDVANVVFVAPKTAWDEPGESSSDVPNPESNERDEANNDSKMAAQTTPIILSEDAIEPSTATMEYPTSTAEAPTETTTATDEAKKNKDNDDDDADEDDDDDEPLSPEEVLHQAVCQALVSLSPKKDLPMLVAMFYAQHVLPNRPEGTTIELKATKYKKFGTYVKEQVAEGLLQVGPDTKSKNPDPMASLTGFWKRHDDLKGFTKKESVTDDGKATKQVLVNLYTIPAHWPALLRLNPDDVKAVNASSEERKGTGMLTTPEVRRILEAYIAREELIVPRRKDQVQLDGPLTDILYKTKQAQASPPPERLSRKDLVNLFTRKLSPAYALVEMPGSRITKLAKGHPPKVEIEVSMRQSKKFVTRVRGLEDYGVDPNYVSKDVAKRFACSATVETEAPSNRPALKKGRVELIFQGNLVEELEALLTGDESLSSHGGAKGSEYGIPHKVLDVTLRKGVPGRKKGGSNKKGK